MAAGQRHQIGVPALEDSRHFLDRVDVADGHGRHAGLALDTAGEGDVAERRGPGDHRPSGNAAG